MEHFLLLIKEFRRDCLFSRNTWAMIADSWWSVQFSPNFLHTSWPMCFYINVSLRRLINTEDIFLERGRPIENKSTISCSRPGFRPKKNGGLDILNLHNQIKSFLPKMFHKFINHHDIPWVHLMREAYYHHGGTNTAIQACSLCWRDCLKLMPTYKNLHICKVHNGASVDFWKVNSVNAPNQGNGPHIFSFPKRYLYPYIPWKLRYFSDHFHLPQYVEAFQQYQDLLFCLNSSQLIGVHDEWALPSGRPVFKVSRICSMLGQYPDTLDLPPCGKPGVNLNTRCISSCSYTSGIILYETAETDQDSTLIDPFLMIWPPLFPVLKDDAWI